MPRNLVFASLNNPDELAKKCEVLWPAGPPKQGEVWYRAPGCTNKDYTDMIRSLFGKTIPTPIASRWYEVDSANYLLIDIDIAPI